MFTACRRSFKVSYFAKEDVITFFDSKIAIDPRYGQGLFYKTF